MSSKLVQTPYDDLTYKIIGCAMATHLKLGPGLREDTYHRDLKVRFDEKRLPYCWEPKLEVYDTVHGTTPIGYYIPDFIVADVVVVEIKALHGFDSSHTEQIIAYLAVTRCPVGLLLNFGSPRLGKRRIFPPKNIAEHRVNHQWLYVPEGWKKS
jgi:GxxExxY protein